ncbi:MAG: hypothetical protein ACTHMG_03940 [Sphingomonas sp.]
MPRFRLMTRGRTRVAGADRIQEERSAANPLPLIAGVILLAIGGAWLWNARDEASLTARTRDRLRPRMPSSNGAGDS